MVSWLGLLFLTIDRLLFLTIDRMITQEMIRVDIIIWLNKVLVSFNCFSTEEVENGMGWLTSGLPMISCDGWYLLDKLGFSLFFYISEA
jgi:hypothetical protein